MMCEGCRILYIIMLWIVVVVVVGRHTRIIRTRVMSIVTACTLRRSFPIPSGTVACVMIYRK